MKRLLLLVLALVLVAPAARAYDHASYNQTGLVIQYDGPDNGSDASTLVNLGSAGNTLQVVLVRPERFETAAEIADHLREKRAVLVNLETTPKDVTRRLVDFLSGVAYAIDGRVKKVASNTYIITPPSVDLMGDLMDELENSGAYL